MQYTQPGYLGPEAIRFAAARALDESWMQWRDQSLRVSTPPPNLSSFYESCTNPSTPALDLHPFTDFASRGCAVWCLEQGAGGRVLELSSRSDCTRWPEPGLCSLTAWKPSLAATCPCVAHLFLPLLYTEFSRSLRGPVDVDRPGEQAKWNQGQFREAFRPLS